MAQRAKICAHQPINEFWALFNKKEQEMKKEPAWEMHSNLSASRDSGSRIFVVMEASTKRQYLCSMDFVNLTRFPSNTSIYLQETFGQQIMDYSICVTTVQQYITNDTSLIKTDWHAIISSAFLHQPVY